MSTKGYPSTWGEFIGKHPRFYEASMVQLTSEPASSWDKQQLVALAVHLNRSSSAVPLLVPFLPAAQEQVQNNPGLMNGLEMFDAADVSNLPAPIMYRQDRSFCHFYELLADVTERQPPPPPPNRPERQRTQTSHPNFSSSEDMDLTPSPPRAESEHSLYTSGSDCSSVEESHQDRQPTRETASRALGNAFFSAVANWAAPLHATAYLRFTMEEKTFNVDFGDRMRFSAVNDGSLLMRRRFGDTQRWLTVREPVYGSVESKRAVLYWFHDARGVAIPMLSLSLLAQVVASMIGLVEQNVRAEGAEFDTLGVFERT
jgi:hypothetical protein